MSHAPAPWKETNSQVSRRILDAHGESVCRIDHDVTADANARLIAAAPMLLQAVQRMFCAVKSGTPDDIDTAIHFALVQWFDADYNSGIELQKKCPRCDVVGTAKASPEDGRVHVQWSNGYHDHCDSIHIVLDPSFGCGHCQAAVEVGK